MFTKRNWVKAQRKKRFFPCFVCSQKISIYNIVYVICSIKTLLPQGILKLLLLIYFPLSKLKPLFPCSFLLIPTSNSISHRLGGVNLLISLRFLKIGHFLSICPPTNSTLCSHLFLDFRNLCKQSLIASSSMLSN